MAKKAHLCGFFLLVGFCFFALAQLLFQRGNARIHLCFTFHQQGSLQFKLIETSLDVVLHFGH